MKRQIFFIMMLFFVLVFSGITTAWWNSSFDRCRNISISNAGYSTLNDYPAYINVSHDENMQPDYDDIRFVNTSCNAGGEMLDHEIEDYDSSSAHVWVRIDNIEPSGKTISLYYGNDGAESGETPGGVWDENYVGVWHLSEDPSTTCSATYEICDSTSNSNHGDALGTMSSADGVDGKSGKALEFDGTDDSIQIGGSVVSGLSSLTIEAWIQASATSQDMGVVGIDPGGSSDGQTGFGYDSEGYESTRSNILKGGLHDAVADGPESSITQSTDWQNVVYVWSTTRRGGFPDFYFDGGIDPDPYDIANYTVSLGTATNWYIGSGRKAYWNGIIDEVRISNIVRSDDWINQSHQMTANQDDYVSLGEEENPNIPKFKNFIFDDSLSSPDKELLLQPNETIKVWCNGSVEDGDGFSDLNKVQGVLYSNSSSAESEDNRTAHYTDPDCSTATWNTNGEFSCEFDLYFFAEAGNWTCLVNVSDNRGFKNSTLDHSIIGELIAIDLSPVVLDFGTLMRGWNSTDNDYVINVSNMGNVEFDLSIDTYYSQPGDPEAMNCTIGNLSVENIRFNETPGIIFSEKRSIPAGSTLEVDFSLGPQRDSIGESPTKKESYWGIKIPEEAADQGGIGGTCSGYIRYDAMIS